MDPAKRKELHETCSTERSACTEKIIKSTSRKKIVVAGPGTGKTTLFGMLLTAAGGTSLTLSFINALVDDLAIGLYGLSEVKTLHGFAVGRLKKIKAETEIFPKLPDVIREDIRILKGEDADFKSMFQDGEGTKEHFDFYKSRKDYYGPYYGFADVIYAVVKLFEQSPEAIPEYGQIVVDEFQDFNKVEVALVDQLAQKSPILLAGDDDQALYVSLKNASPEHIRQKHSNAKHGYESHTLPYCSRSTEVIVLAINDLVNNAQANGLLKGRIDKPYVYFSDVAKDRESTAYPLIDHTTIHEPQIAWFVQERLEELITKERKKLEVLIVVPPQVKKHGLPKIIRLLREKGFKNIKFSDSNDPKEPTFRDGLRLLLINKGDNLGWRVLAKILLSPEVLEATLKDGASTGKPLIEILPKEFTEEILGVVKTVKKLKGEKAAEVSDDDLKRILAQLGYDVRAENMLWLEERLGDEEPNSNRRGLRDAQITVTTVPSSKGLAADYVFVTHLDQAYYTQEGKGVISDDNVFSFLVALTRARKKVFLISTQAGKEAALLKWVDKTRINSI